MRNRNHTSKLLALAVIVAACGAALARAPREFAGSYRILQTTNQGNQIEVRISLRVFNYSGAEVKDATISLQSSLPHPPGFGEAWEKQQPCFQGVALHVNEPRPMKPLEETFTVPAREYQEWLKGAQPRFVVDYEDASGKPHHRAIELMRRR